MGKDHKTVNINKTMLRPN